MPALAALQYGQDAFDTRVGKLMGRQMAGQTFLKAWIEYSGADPLTSWTANDKERDAFIAHARELGASGPVASAQPTNLDPLHQAGALWLADPSLDRYAWQRRWRRQDAYSIVGITHTLSTHPAMERIAALLTAPVQPWDALICTSHAARQAVAAVLEAEAEYLKARLGATILAGPALSVIPLGVSCNTLAFDPAARARWRKKLRLADDDIAVLQFGRIALHAKAHPTPLYLALARAGERCGRPFHLIMAGKFINAQQDKDHHALARQFAGRVETHFVDGTLPDIDGIRSAADIGTLLSDNIQETFGLAPVELMAAGLPVVATDWDGLRDTIEQGVTGFRVDTLIPRRGVGEVMARRHDTIETNDVFLGGVVQSTALDIAQAAQAFVTLADDPALRRTMGAAAAKRARASYDWPVVIRAYRDLLAELAERRTGDAGERVPRKPGGPARSSRLEPFTAFAGHATAQIGHDTRIRATPDAPASVVDVPGGVPMSLLHPPVMAPAATIDAMIARIATGPLTVADLIAAFPATDPGHIYLAVGWLLKFGYAERA